LLDGNGVRGGETKERDETKFPGRYLPLLIWGKPLERQSSAMTTMTPDMMNVTTIGLSFYFFEVRLTQAGFQSREPSMWKKAKH
jgi:hypothetical protein